MKQETKAIKYILEGHRKRFREAQEQLKAAVEQCLPPGVVIIAGGTVYVVARTPAGWPHPDKAPCRYRNPHARAGVLIPVAFADITEILSAP